MKKVEKKKGKVFTIIALILSILLLVDIGLLVYQIITLNVLPTALLIPVCIIIVLIALLLLVLLNFYVKHIFTKFLAVLLTIALIGVSGVGNYYVHSTYGMLHKVTSNTGTVKNTVSIISMSSSGISDLKDLKGKTVAELKNIDTYGTKQLRSAIRKENDLESTDDLPFTQVNANSVQEMVNSLYNGDVDAIVLNETYRSNVKEFDNFANFDTDTNVVYQCVYYTESENESLAVSDITKTPFNILVSGKDTEGDTDEAARSDVNMVVTVNPLTSTVLLTSIPRDSYVETVCSGYDTCTVGGMDKITHTGIYGIGTTKATVENYLGITINYTFEANYTSVVKIVDALGGIDVTVEPGMAVSHFYSDSTLEGVTEGENHLDGARALAFARERHAYLDGDNQRVRNQQQVLEAIFAKATSPDVITNYASLMEAVSDSFTTNLTTDEITDLIKYQIQTGTEWKFESYQISGYGDMLECAALGSEASVTVPYEEAATIAHDKIQAVLDGKSSDTIEDTLGATEAQGALSTEEIEAQIEAGKYEEEGYYYTDDSSYYYTDDSYYYTDDSTYTEDTYVDDGSQTE